MSVRSLAYLKQRFKTLAQPAQKDWTDLIDTLAALAPGSITTAALADESVTPPKLFPGDPLEVMATDESGDANWVSLAIQHMATSYVLVDAADAGENILHIVPATLPATLSGVNLSYLVKSGQDITGASTLQVGPTLNLPIRVGGAETAEGDIVDGEVYLFFLDGTYAHIVKASTAALEEAIAEIQAALAGGIVLTKAESDPIALPTVNNTEIFFEHGLGAAPEIYDVFLQAKVTQNGYVIGDRISMIDHCAVYANGAYSGPFCNAFHIKVDATEIRVIGLWAGYPMRHLSNTLAQIVITDTNWDVVFVAYGQPSV